MTALGLKCTRTIIHRVDDLNNLTLFLDTEDKDFIVSLVDEEYYTKLHNSFYDSPINDFPTSVYCKLNLVPDSLFKVNDDIHYIQLIHSLTLRSSLVVKGKPSYFGPFKDRSFAENTLKYLINNINSFYFNYPLEWDLDHYELNYLNISYNTLAHKRMNVKNITGNILNLKIT